MENAPATWHIEHHIETALPPGRLWALFEDVSGWRRWNAGVEDSALEGPFAAGTWFSMKPSGQDPLRSRLIAVHEGESFVDETRVGELVVTVSHRIDRGASGLTRISYALDAAGPEATEIGPMIAADFPEVLARLVAFAGSLQP